MRGSRVISIADCNSKNKYLARKNVLKYLEIELKIELIHFET